MGHRRRSDPRTRTRRRFLVEALEPRELLSVAQAFFARMARPADVGTADAAPVPQPVPHEQAREAFTANFSGRYVTGPGRFTDQAFQTFLSGGGTSSAFLHGDLQMSIISPADPTKPVTGLASLIVKNDANTGNLLSLELRGDPQPDGRGRPTLLSWTVGSNSGGTFSGATGQGTVAIRYRPGGKLPPRATSSGGVSVIFRGQVNTTGVSNVMRL